MRRLLLVAATLAAASAAVAQYTGPRLVFHAPLDRNGIDPGTAGITAAMLPSEIPVPDVQWWGGDPTGASGITSHAFTATGAPVEVDTPFCPDGDFSDLTASNCLKAMQFSGTNQYYNSDDNDVGDIAAGDFSACAIYRSADGANGVLTGNKEGASCSGEGWSLSLTTTTSVSWTHEDHAANSGVATWNTSIPGTSWAISCGTFDYDGNRSAFVNGIIDDDEAGVGDVIDTANEPLSVGACNDGNVEYAGAIAAVFTWDSLLTDAQILDFSEHWQGVLTTTGANPTTRTNTGPTCCWIDGLIECFSDDWMKVGCEIPPNVTGVGTPAAGYFAQPSYTNALPYSRDLSNGWSEVGTSVTCAQATTPFRDGRTTCIVDDDDAGAFEFVRRQTAGHGLSNGDKIQVCAYARADSSQTFDFQMAELGGVCAGGTQTYGYDAHTVDTSWKEYEWTHTITDDTCTSVRFDLLPHDVADGVAGTGHVYFVVQSFNDQDYCPPTYIETEASAVTAGQTADIMSAADPVTSGGAIRGQLIVEFDYAPFSNDHTANSYLLELSDNSASDRLLLFVSGTEKIYFYAVSGGAGGAYLIESAAQTWTAGTFKHLRLQINYETDTHTMWIDGAVAGTSTTAKLSPVGITDINIGSDMVETQQGLHGGAIKNVKVWR